jgi:hypothetical protein
MPLEQRERLWRRITCGLGILSLMILPVRSISAQEDSPQIQANRFNPPHSGLSLKKSGENFIISSGFRIQSLSPSVAYNSKNNEYMVVWFDLRNQATTGNDIFAQRVSARGRLRGNSIPVITNPEAQIDPSIAYNSIDNSYLISWRTQLHNRAPDDAFGRIVSNDGMFAGKEFSSPKAALKFLLHITRTTTTIW